MSGKKPRIDQLPGSMAEEVMVEENESTTVAMPEIQWITIRVPYFVGDLGGAYRPDQVYMRLSGPNKETYKRLLRAIDMEGSELRNGKRCTEDCRQDAGLYLLERIAEQLS